MKKLGIIGGLGPMATARFLALITAMTAAEKDQDHIEILLHSRPAIPDRTAFILGKSSDSPLPDLCAVAAGLAKAGAEILAIPCFTAHLFYRQICEAARIPVIDAIGETVAHLQSAAINRVGILATDGTLHSRLFQDRLAEADISAICPDDDIQRLVMDIIYNEVKKGARISSAKLDAITGHMHDKGAQTILLGCSELSLLKDFDAPPTTPPLLDVLTVLARSAVLHCATLHPEYEDLRM